jgi:hypothetical protein
MAESGAPIAALPTVTCVICYAVSDPATPPVEQGWLRKAGGWVCANDRNRRPAVRG